MNRNKRAAGRLSKWIFFPAGVFLAASILLPALTGAGDDFHPKLEQRVFELMNSWMSKGPGAGLRTARGLGVEVMGDRIRVVVTLIGASDPRLTAAPSPQAVGALIAGLGGEVETSYGRMIQVMLPIGEIAALASLGEVKSIRLPFYAVPLETSEGVSATGADVWQNTGAYRGGGRGVKVCILDAGFEDYESLLGSELPGSLTTRSFRADGNLEASPHGTACAEIVHDMAPEADLLLVNFSTDVEHHNAVEWIIGQGVDVISYSMGWFAAGAGDGTGPICADVERAASEGLVWVSAAGNSAQRHWQGKFKDLDEDGWMEFKQVGAGRDDLSFYVESGDVYQIWLSWDDWGTWNGSDYTGAEGQDFDLYLYNNATGKLIASSRNSQTSGYYPVEGIAVEAKARGWRHIRIKKRSASRDCRLEIFFHRVSELEHNETYGSLNIPADSAYALAVGAVDWRDDAYHSYSSMGPTTDSRVKPDICAPSGVSTSTYGEVNFYGTSAATPHVAGALALLLAKTPYSVSQVQAILLGRVKDLGIAGRDNTYGEGRLKLDR